MTFWGHVTTSVTWDSQYVVCYRWSIWTDHLSHTVVEILSLKILRSWPWTFGVKWHHGPHDQWARNVQFPTGGQFKPSIYRAQLLRHWASKILGHNGRKKANKTALTTLKEIWKKWKESILHTDTLVFSALTLLVGQQEG